MGKLTDEQKIEAYIEYCNNPCYDQYFNALEVLNINEESISQLLAWLLNVNGKSETSIQFKFCNAFMDLLQEKDIINQQERENISISHVEAFPEKVKIKDKGRKFDILVKTNILDFVIENKKRATISCPQENEKSSTYITQIEKYYYQIKNSKDYDINRTKFIYLCAKKEDTIEKISKKLEHCKKNLVVVNSNIESKQLDYSQIKDKPVCWLLEYFGYSIVEHKDLIIKLYNILKDIYPQAFCYRGTILKPSEPTNMLKLLSELINIKGTKDNSERKNIRNLIGDSKLEDYVADCLENREYFRNKDYLLKKLRVNIGGKNMLYFYDYLNKKEVNYYDILNLLCAYIEYWELHSDVDEKDCTGRDNLEGESKIVDGEYIWYVFKRIYNNKYETKWKEIKKIAKDINSESLNLIVNYMK